MDINKILMNWKSKECEKVAMEISILKLKIYRLDVDELFESNCQLAAVRFKMTTSDSNAYRISANN